MCGRQVAAWLEDRIVLSLPAGQGILVNKITILFLKYVTDFKIFICTYKTIITPNHKQLSEKSVSAIVWYNYSRNCKNHVKDGKRAAGREEKYNMRWEAFKTVGNGYIGEIDEELWRLENSHQTIAPSKKKLNKKHTRLNRFLFLFHFYFIARFSLRVARAVARDSVATLQGLLTPCISLRWSSKQ